MGYIRAYITHAYQAQGFNRMPRTSPNEDLKVMQRYWQLFYGLQDSRLVCLQVEQKFLFDQQVDLLVKDIESLRRFVSETTLKQLTTGLTFQQHDNTGSVRMNFVDVMTRRFLLRACALVKLVGANYDNFKSIKMIVAMKFEQYKNLPAAYAGDQLVGPAVAEMHAKQQRKITELMDEFDKRNTQEFPNSDEYNPLIEDIDALCKGKQKEYIDKWH